jgi:hypothetical protein
MNSTQVSHPVHLRIFISLLTALSFLAMSLSGIAAFISPQGRVAYWTIWTFLGLTKSAWGDIHITTSVLFLIAGIWHTCYNWTLLMQYLRKVPDRTATYRRELLAAIVVTLFFTVGAFMKAPPLNYLLTLNNTIKESWVRSAADDPPYGHAELSTLKSLCTKMQINLAEAMKVFKEQSIVVISADQKFEQIAGANSRTPAALYALIKHLEDKDSPRQTVSSSNTKTMVSAVAASKTAAIATYTEEIVSQRFEGKGIGRKTFAAICTELRLNPIQISEKLSRQKIEIQPDETLKLAAERLGKAPIELLHTILVGEPIR